MNGNGHGRMNGHERPATLYELWRHHNEKSAHQFAVRPRAHFPHILYAGSAAFANLSMASPAIAMRVSSKRWMALSSVARFPCFTDGKGA